MNEHGGPATGLRHQLLKKVEGDSPSAPRASPMAAKYRALSEFALEHPRFVSTLASVVDVKLYDELQDCVANLCRPAETLEVIKSLLRVEFERKAAKESGSILRGASLAAKMSSRHARAVGTSYLAELFSQWIRSAQDLGELNVEVPEDKAKLLELTNAVIGLISRDDKVAAIPKDIREMARLIGELCDTYLPDQKWPLVGGLVLLRLYSPTLISPTTYGLLPVDYPLSAALRKNLMQVTRLLQNASNHQPFKDGPNMALNDWVDGAGRLIDAFLAKVVAAGGGVASNGTAGDGPAPRNDDATVLKFVQLFVQHKAKLKLELESCPEDFRPLVVRFDELLGACGNPFRQRTGTVALASEALNLSLGGLANKRALDQDAFAATLAQYKWPSAFLKDYLAHTTPRPREQTVALCALICNDKHGVPCAPKVGKKENHLVFVGRDGVDWMMENLALAERETQCVATLQEMCDLDLVVPWQTEKREKKSGVRFEDGDRFYWFDYAAILSKKGLVSARGANESDEREVRRALANLQLDKLGRAGILESALPPGVTADETTLREQWRLLLTLVWNLSLSPCAVVKGEATADDSPLVAESEVDNWCRSFLGFRLPAHTAELLKNLANDGFVFERDGKWGFHWHKIRQWHEKTFGPSATRTPRNSDSLPSPKQSHRTPRGGEPLPSPKPSAAATRMSLRGKMGQQRSSVTLPAGSPDDSSPSPPSGASPSSVSPPLSGRETSGGQVERGPASLFKRNSTSPAIVVPPSRLSSGPGSVATTPSSGAVTPASGTPTASGRDTLTRSTGARRAIPSLDKEGGNLSRSASAGPASGIEDDSSGEPEEREDGSDVSMMDFLNTDPDELKAEGTLSKGRSSRGLKGLFAKKEKSDPKIARNKSSGGLFSRK